MSKRYKIVECKKGQYRVYVQHWSRLFWVNYFKLPLNLWPLYETYYVYDMDVAKRTVAALVESDKRKEEAKLAKKKFEKKSTYFNKDGKEYDPKYGDGTKSYIGIGRP
jgi:hypothetical protein